MLLPSCLELASGGTLTADMWVKATNSPCHVVRTAQPQATSSTEHTLIVLATQTLTELWSW
jgi:hypothetical protein